MAENSLRSSLIRLAHCKPHLRQDLLPLVTASSGHMLGDLLGGLLPLTKNPKSFLTAFSEALESWALDSMVYWKKIDLDQVVKTDPEYGVPSVVTVDLVGSQGIPRLAADLSRELRGHLLDSRSFFDLLPKVLETPRMAKVLASFLSKGMVGQGYGYLPQTKLEVVFTQILDNVDDLMVYYDIQSIEGASLSGKVLGDKIVFSGTAQLKLSLDVDDEGLVSF